MSLLSDYFPIRFLHRVSVSTIRYGMTVPVAAQQSWLTHIGKGERIPITLCFNDIEITADITRINNAVGHLQIRYDRKINQPFKNALEQLIEQSEDADNVVVEVKETDRCQFHVLPFCGAGKIPSLAVSQPVLHCLDKSVTKINLEYADLADAIQSVNFIADYRQSDYNKMIANRLTERNWIAEPAVVDGLGLHCDFRKNGVWLEVEFGNARVYYQDYIKFLVAEKYHQYQFGILLCPMASFAGYLCELGTISAQRKRSDSRQSKYSGMMTHEKATRELPYLAHFLNTKLIIAGLNVANHI